MSADRNDWTVKRMLEWATDYFDKKGIPDPRHSIEWLLAETLNVKRLDLYLTFDRPLSPSELDDLRPLIKRRAHHEPLQHITGYSDFMNARISVSPEVLIPRIETEQLVEIILDDHSKNSELTVLDIGTGSGCIPVALKMERPSWEVQAVDISEEALQVARKNAEANEVEITFRQADINNHREWSFEQSFDLIVSNPPYIMPDEKNQLEPQVKKHEPALALFCENIEMMYQNIIDYAGQNLTPGGTLYLELNAAYSDLIMDLFAPDQWKKSLIKDYDKKPRFIKADLSS